MNERDFIAGYAHAPPLALMHNHFLDKFVEHGVCRKEFDELYLRNADGEAVSKESVRVFYVKQAMRSYDRIALDFLGCLGII